MARAKQKVIILGAGFAGFYAALRFEQLLKHFADLDVTLIDKENFFLFTPMLHEIAAGDLSFQDIVCPLRKMFRQVTFYKGQIESIDFAKQKIQLHYGECNQKISLDYDHLLLSLGSVADFSHLQGAQKNILSIKTLGDAVYLRNHVIAKLEEAELETSIENREKKLTFVIAGGGFAGVETIAAINDFVRESIKYYPHLHDNLVKIIVVHAHEPVLPEFDQDLGYYAQQKLKERGIEVITNTEVESFNNGAVQLSTGSEIICDTLIWTVGVSANSLLEDLDCKKEHRRIVVNEYLQLQGKQNIWAAGDCAFILNKKTGKAYPPTAQHAIREGRLAAENIFAAIRSQPLSAFKYQSLGQMAAIGRRTGIGIILGIKVAGFIGWFMWRTIYLLKLPGLDRKIRVGFGWLLDLIFPPDLVQYMSTEDRMNTSILPDCSSVHQTRVTNKEPVEIKNR